MTEETIKLTCECGKQFERPLKYKTYSEECPNVMWRWKLAYCDSCFNKRVEMAFATLPKVIDALIKDEPVEL